MMFNIYKIRKNCIAKVERKQSIVSQQYEKIHKICQQIKTDVLQNIDAYCQYENSILLKELTFVHPEYHYIISESDIKLMKNFQKENEIESYLKDIQNHNFSGRSYWNANKDRNSEMKLKYIEAMSVIMGKEKERQMIVKYVKAKQVIENSHDMKERTVFDIINKNFIYNFTRSQPRRRMIDESDE